MKTHPTGVCHVRIQPVDFSLQLATSSASLLPLIPPICFVLLNPLFRATRIPVTGKDRQTAEVQS